MLVKLNYDKFETIWLARIGPEATRELYKYAVFVINGFYAYILAVLGGFLLAQKNGLLHIIGGLCIVLMVIYFYFTYFRKRGQIALALSSWYGVKVRRRQVPFKWTPKVFDKWASVKGSKHNDPNESSSEH